MSHHCEQAVATRAWLFCGLLTLLLGIARHYARRARAHPMAPLAARDEAQFASLALERARNRMAGP
ncbi:hypothetical protein ACWGI8_08270 [Streptomyces sp. NPDC054841]